MLGVRSSPFWLTSAFNKHIETYNNEDSKFVEWFLRSLHVDNLGSGSQNIQDCYNFNNKAKARLKQASFNLLFLSNLCDLNQFFVWKFSWFDLSMSNKKATSKFCGTCIRPLCSYQTIYLKALFQMICREKLSWNDMLSEVCLKGILKLVLKFSCMVSLMLVHQITVVGYIFDIIIIIASLHPLFFYIVELHQLNYRLFPV